MIHEQNADFLDGMKKTGGGTKTETGGLQHLVTVYAIYDLYIAYTTSQIGGFRRYAWVQ
jgi:hypothetical protein